MKNKRVEILGQEKEEKNNPDCKECTNRKSEGTICITCFLDQMNCFNCNNVLVAHGLVLINWIWYCNSCGIELKDFDFNKFYNNKYNYDIIFK